MASRRPTQNFVTSPSGILAPQVTDDPVNDRTDITFEIAVSTTDGDVLTTEMGQAVWAPAVGSDPDDATEVWMPLTSTVAGVDVLVFDADHSLIPTLIPF